MTSSPGIEPGPHWWEAGALWSRHTKRKINSLEQVQVILGRDYSEHERLGKLNLLPLQYRREINDLVFSFKCFKNMTV